jgi:hypothetical protein
MDTQLQGIGAHPGGGSPRSSSAAHAAGFAPMASRHRVDGLCCRRPSPSNGRLVSPPPKFNAVCVLGWARQSPRGSEQVHRTGVLS